LASQAASELRETPIVDGTARRKPVPLSFWLHSVFGLKLSLFLAFVCLTGTIATVAHEIEWLYKPQLRATTVTGQADWGAMWNAAQAAHPEAKLGGLGSFDRNDAPYFVKAVSATDANGEEFTIYVDPGTNRVTGHEYGRSFQDFMRALHYYLFAPGTIPMYIVTALGFVLILSLITGLMAYKKFWRSFFRKPRWHRDMRTWMGDLHRLVGLWSLWFVAVIGLTSIWYFVEHAGLDLETPEPTIAVAKAELAVSGAQISNWTAIAEARMPGLAITAVYLPYEPGNPVVVQGQWRAWLVRERTNAIFIDPQSGTIIGERIAHQMGIGERIVNTADPLHFGTFGGLATKLMWVLFGLLLTGMAGSGAYIYAKRTKQAVSSGVRLGFLDYLGHWKWPSVIAITVVPVVSFLLW
jgi:uncharacterized iron-regulated membrane protein